ncbi:Protein priB [Ceratobasidium theobromae]|uniref:Protein priB n=1 Tax=Ceratobasidium theobromae TaxID=1582974 RepID=A0A5N5QH30_9AGAM|nr:Protein priB [Ceratobasidium theobromae]
MDKRSFLAYGTATDVWLVESPIRKRVRVDQGGEDIRKRVGQWTALVHPNLVRVFGWRECSGLELCVEYCPRGTALQGKLFVDQAGATKIGEFGIAELVSRVSRLQVGSTATRWTSPELLDLPVDGIACPTTASDIWALGCTMFHVSQPPAILFISVAAHPSVEIATGKVPYAECTHEWAVYSQIIAGKPPGRRDLSAAVEMDCIWQGVEMCCKLDSEDRPDARELWRIVGGSGRPDDVDDWVLVPDLPEQVSGLGETDAVMGNSTSSLSMPRLPGAQEQLSFSSNSFTGNPGTGLASQPPGPSAVQATRFVHFEEPHQRSSPPLLGFTHAPSFNTYSSPFSPDSSGWNGGELRVAPQMGHGMLDQNPNMTNMSTQSTQIQPNIHGTQQSSTVARAKRPRLPRAGACKNCKRLKVKCVFEFIDSVACRRCQEDSKDCFIEGRRRSRAPNPLEILLNELEQKEKIIDGLLQIISESRGDDAQSTGTPRVWKSVKPARPPIDIKTKVGVADMGCLQLGPVSHPYLRRIIRERRVVPEILMVEAVTDEEAELLFQVFHERINLTIAILDPVLHTAEKVKDQCLFLFTVVCAIASRYWTERPELYPALMEHAKSAAAITITDGWSSLENCQAYLLLSLYPPPIQNQTEDRVSLYLGCAISRMAMELTFDPHTNPGFINEPQDQERKKLNGIRTQLACFNMDHTLATRLGRPITISEDCVDQQSRDWWRYARCTWGWTLIYSDPDSPSGFNENVDFGQITHAFDDKMEQFRRDAKRAYFDDLDFHRSVHSYLFALMSSLGACTSVWLGVSTGFPFASASTLYRHKPNITNPLIESIDAASEVLWISDEYLSIHDLHRYSPDGHWAWSMSAAAFLVKISKPRTNLSHQWIVNESQRSASLALVESLIIAMERSATDGQHLPALYARLLKWAMSVKVHEPAAPGGMCTSANVDHNTKPEIMCRGKANDALEKLVHM